MRLILLPRKTFGICTIRTTVYSFCFDMRILPGLAYRFETRTIEPKSELYFSQFFFWTTTETGIIMCWLNRELYSTLYQGSKPFLATTVLQGERRRVVPVCHRNCKISQVSESGRYLRKARRREPGQCLLLFHPFFFC